MASTAKTATHFWIVKIEFATFPGSSLGINFYVEKYCVLFSIVTRGSGIFLATRSHWPSKTKVYLMTLEKPENNQGGRPMSSCSKIIWITAPSAPLSLSPRTSSMIRLSCKIFITAWLSKPRKEENERKYFKVKKKTKTKSKLRTDSWW